MFRRALAKGFAHKCSGGVFLEESGLQLGFSSVIQRLRDGSSIASGTSQITSNNMTKMFNRFLHDGAKLWVPKERTAKSLAFNTPRVMSRFMTPMRSSNYGYRYNRYLDPNKVVWSLIGANAAVFMLWRVDPIFARRNFVVSLYSSVHRPWTILTSSFSHADFGHFASNMVTLYFFGSSLGRVVGGQNVGSCFNSHCHCSCQDDWNKS